MTNNKTLVINAEPLETIQATDLGADILKLASDLAQDIYKIVQDVS